MQDKVAECLVPYALQPRQWRERVSLALQPRHEEGWVVDGHVVVKDNEDVLGTGQERELGGTGAD